VIEGTNQRSNGSRNPPVFSAANWLDEKAMIAAIQSTGGSHESRRVTRL
jgi:hypothetical protein